MRIDTNGNIGIGTTTPTSNLQVTQPTTGVGTVSNLAGGTTVTGVGTQFTNTFKVGDTITIGGQTVAISAIASDTSMTTAAITNANTNVAYTLAGGDRFVVKGNGNVGIGTTNPGIYKLNVSGVGADATTRQLIRDTGTNSQAILELQNDARTYAIKVDGANQTDDMFKIYDGTASLDRFVINSTGNVGIGTTSPGSLLNIKSSFPEFNIETSNASARGAINFVTSGGNAWRLGSYVTTAENGNFEFVEGSNTRIYIKPGGNIGIGTTNPGEHLSIEGTGDQSLSVYSSTTGVFNTPKSFIKFFGQDTGSVKREQARISSAPGASTSTAGQLIFSTNNSSNVLSERLRIDEAGNVGIGTASPGGLLDVNSKLIVASNGDITQATTGGFAMWAANSATWPTYGFTGDSGVGMYRPATDELRFTTAGSDRMTINSSGKVLINATSDSSDSKLYISGTTANNGSTSAIAGILGGYTFNPTAGGVQVGNRFVVTNSPTTAANTSIGEIVRTVDNTTLVNTVRGIDVTSNGGSNTAGTNTGIRATGATFGIQGLTPATAGGVYVPAAIYGENTGTTAGDVLRLYSNSVTSAPSFATFYHDTSAFTGTGLLMSFATGSGSFTGDFASFNKNNVTVFKVTNGGVVSMGLSSTAATSAVCSSLANGTAPTADTAYEIRDCSNTPVADYAEMYPVEAGAEVGDIVASGTEVVATYDVKDNGGIDWTKVKGNITKLVKSGATYQSNVIGIVSNNTNDFSSTGYNIKEADHPMPIALNGRVPVKVSSSSEPIKSGDYVTTSTEAGKAMKSIESGYVIGKALEDWNPNSGKDMVMIFVEQGYNEIPIYQNLGLKILEIADMAKSNIWRDAITSWLGNAANKITRIFTGEICLTDDTGQSECINRSELHNLKMMMSLPAQALPPSSTTNTQTPSAPLSGGTITPTTSTPSVAATPSTSTVAPVTTTTLPSATATTTTPTSTATTDTTTSVPATSTTPSTSTVTTDTSPAGSEPSASAPTATQ